MEMKHRRKYGFSRYSNQGFTMVELLVAMVISLLALAAIYSTFLSQHKSYQVQAETADMQQNIRTAMYYMQREIRMAGNNPHKTLPLSAFGITAAGPTSITFSEDIRGNNPGDPPDGAVDDPGENISYFLNGTDLQRRDNTTVPADQQTVAQNIDWIDFVYLDSDGIPTAILANIRSVEITIVARTDDPLLYSPVNNNIYRNKQGTAIFGPAGDNVSRRRLTALIHCRNLDL